MIIVFLSLCPFVLVHTIQVVHVCLRFNTKVAEFVRHTNDTLTWMACVSLSVMYSMWFLKIQFNWRFYWMPELKLVIWGWVFEILWPEVRTSTITFFLIRAKYYFDCVFLNCNEEKECYEFYSLGVSMLHRNF